MRLPAGLLIPQLVFVLLLTGCNLMPTAKFDPNDPSSSVVYGYIDTEQMSSQYEWVKIRGEEGKDDYVTATTTKDGAFYHIAVRPGRRYVSAFGGWNSGSIHAQNKATTFSFDENDRNAPSVNIKKPGVHFMGAYTLLVAKKTFDLRPAKKPSKKAILKMILNEMERNGHKDFYPRQYGMIKEEIGRLR